MFRKYSCIFDILRRGVLDACIHVFLVYNNMHIQYIINTLYHILLLYFANCRSKIKYVIHKLKQEHFKNLYTKQYLKKPRINWHIEISMAFRLIRLLIRTSH